MRELTIIIASVACCLSASAFAQTTPAAPRDSTTMQTSATTPAPAAQNQWQSDDGSADGLTRADVYQQLVQAENDGSLAHLNATVYAHH